MVGCIGLVMLLSQFSLFPALTFSYQCTGLRGLMCSLVGSQVISHVEAFIIFHIPGLLLLMSYNKITVQHTEFIVGAIPHTLASIHCCFITFIWAMNRSYRQCFFFSLPKDFSL